MAKKKTAKQKGSKRARQKTVKRIEIWYDRNGGIQVDKYYETCDENGPGVEWIAGDSNRYKVSFNKNGKPFKAGKFEPIRNNNPKASGKPKKGVARPGGYEYTVYMLGSNKRLDPTIKVDP